MVTFQPFLIVNSFMLCCLIDKRGSTIGAEGDILKVSEMQLLRYLNLSLSRLFLFI